MGGEECEEKGNRDFFSFMVIFILGPFYGPRESYATEPITDRLTRLEEGQKSLRKEVILRFEYLALSPCIYNFSEKI